MNVTNKRTIIISVSNQGIFLNPSMCLSLSKTNIPFDALQFKDSKSIYWLAEMISYDSNSALLRLKIVDYNPSEVSNFTNQKPKALVEQISFEAFHWNTFQLFLSSYKLKDIESIITREEFVKPILKEFEVAQRVSISKLKFEMGYVSFTKKFKWAKGQDKYRITLPESIPEYDYIKAYFSKILKKKSIDVQFQIKSDQSSTYVSKVVSHDLNKINSESIHVLKIQKMHEWSTKRPKFDAPDKALFDFDEMIALYDDQALGNVDVFEKDLLFQVLEQKDIRNKFQLKHLSAHIHNENLKLMLTLVPQFGFVFTHVGREMIHFIWELLESHATYIWSIPLTHRNKAREKVENEIKAINALGRTMYKSQFEARDDLFFNILVHKSSNYSYEQYFSKWRLKLESLLI